MGVPEHIEQLLVGNLLRVEFNLDDFGMARFAGADLFVSRLVLFAAGITAGHRLDAIEPFKHGLQAPETASAKRGELGGGATVAVLSEAFIQSRRTQPSDRGKGKPLRADYPRASQ